MDRPRHPARAFRILAMKTIIEEIRSFRHDWARWSSAERLASRLALAALALGAVAAASS